MALRRVYEVKDQQALIELGSEVARIAAYWGEKHGYEFAISISTLEGHGGDNPCILKVVARRRRTRELKQAEELLKIAVRRVQQGDC